MCSTLYLDIMKHFNSLPYKYNIFHKNKTLNYVDLLLYHQPKGKCDLWREPDQAFWDLENQLFSWTEEKMFHFLGSSRGGWWRCCELLFFYRSLELIESLNVISEKDDKHALVSLKWSFVMKFLIKGTEDYCHSCTIIIT